MTRKAHVFIFLLAAYTALKYISGFSSFVIDFFVISLLLFFLPGYYFLKTFFVNSSKLPIWDVVALSMTFSILFSTLIGFINIIVDFAIKIYPWALLGLVLSFSFLSKGSYPHNISSPLKSDFLVIGMLFLYSSFPFLYNTYLSPNPTPFPYHLGWDIFVYTTLAHLITNKIITFPVTDINPLTDELPIPLGFPALLAQMYSFMEILPHDVILLLKIGPIISSFISSVVVYAIVRNYFNPFISAIAPLLMLSFNGHNVADPKWFVPASFGWIMGLAALHSFLSPNLSSNIKVRLCLFFCLSTFIFHIYNGVLVTVTVLVTIFSLSMLNRIPAKLFIDLKLYGSYKRLTIPTLRPAAIVLGVAVLALAVIYLNLSGASFVIAGGGVEVGSTTLMIDKAFFFLKSASPSIWILGLYSLIHLVKLDNKTHDLICYLVLLLLFTLCLYFVPISSSFRMLYWPAVPASILSAHVIGSLLDKLKRGENRTRLLVVSLTLVMIFGAIVFPTYIPLAVQPDYRFQVDGRPIQSNYSLSEYRAAVFINENFRSRQMLIFSDVGFSLMLGALTGKNSVRSQSDRIPPSLVSKFASEPVDNVIPELLSTLSRYYDLSKYDSILIALSSRTYAWIKAPTIIFYAPIIPERVDIALLDNFKSSKMLKHIYQGGDVSLFLLELGNTK